MLMLSRKPLAAAILISPSIYFLALQQYLFFSIYIVSLALAEIFTYLLVNNLRKSFPWLITTKDENPEIREEDLDKFMEHGFDRELGWVRKPNPKKEEKGKWGATFYEIDERGSRRDPEHESLPSKIAVFGDSFAFARQVNDNQTWSWHLAEKTQTHVLNFAVGNYGLDQALLRLKREYPRNPTSVVIMGVVPSTIVRILSMWKHYNEFGNTFASKPSFKLNPNNRNSETAKQLILVPNLLDAREKFLNLKDHIRKFRDNDYFYKRQFRRDMIRFPYIASVLSDPRRNLRLIALILKSKFLESEDLKKTQVYGTPMKVIMEINLKQRINLYKNEPNAVDLMIALTEEFANYANERKFKPVFLFLPQKDDVLYARKKGKFYANFLSKIQSLLPVMDFADDLISRNDLDDLYSDDNKYGGHYSLKGNVILGEKVFGFLLENKLI